MANASKAYTQSPKTCIMINFLTACELYLALSISSYASLPAKGVTGIGLWKHLWPENALTHSQGFLCGSLKKVRPFYFGSRRLPSTPSDLKWARAVWGNALRVLFHQAVACETPKRMEIWSPSRRRKNAAGLSGAHDSQSALDPAACGQAVASGAREESDLRGTQREEAGREQERG